MDFVALVTSLDGSEVDSALLLHLSMSTRSANQQTAQTRCHSVPGCALAFTQHPPRDTTRAFMGKEWLLVTQGSGCGLFPAEGKRLLDLLESGAPEHHVCVASGGRLAIYATHVSGRWWVARDSVGVIPVYFGEDHDSNLVQVSSERRGSRRWRQSISHLPPGTWISQSRYDAPTQWYTRPLYPLFATAHGDRESTLHLLGRAVAVLPPPRCEKGVAVLTRSRSPTLASLLSRCVARAGLHVVQMVHRVSPEPSEDTVTTTVGTHRMSVCHLHPRHIVAAILDMMHLMECAGCRLGFLCSMAPMWQLMSRARSTGVESVVLDHHNPRLLLGEDSSPMMDRAQVKAEVSFLVQMARVIGVTLVFPLLDIHLNEHLALRPNAVTVSSLLGGGPVEVQHPLGESPEHTEKVVMDYLQTQKTTIHKLSLRMKEFTSDVNELDHARDSPS